MANATFAPCVTKQYTHGTRSATAAIEYTTDAATPNQTNTVNPRPHRPRPLTHAASIAAKYENPTNDTGHPIPGIVPNAVRAAWSHGLPAPHPGSATAPKWCKHSIPEAPTATASATIPEIHNKRGTGTGWVGGGVFMVVAKEYPRPYALSTAYSPAKIPDRGAWHHPVRTVPSPPGNTRAA